jgi:high-affinity nickel-transport protein
MTLVDSLDSILMLYSYSGFAERTFAISEPVKLPSDDGLDTSSQVHALNSPRDESPERNVPQRLQLVQEDVQGTDPVEEVPEIGLHNTPIVEEKARDQRVKRNMMSGLSIILTLMSIVIAFTSAILHYHCVYTANMPP